MEKKKLLIVAISVGVFLVLTIGAAILVFTPKNTPPATSALASYPAQEIDTGITVPPPAASAGQPASLDPVDLVRRPGDVPGLQSPPEGTTRQTEDFQSSAETLISVPKPSTAAVPDAAPAGRAAPRSSAETPRAQPASTPQAAASPPANAAQAKPAAQTRVYNDYWVQTGAFSTVTKAESVKATLSSKGINSIIENGEINGNTLFRVRVGPYTSQNEANYWLSLIKSIDGFEDSQVRQTQSRR